MAILELGFEDGRKLRRLSSIYADAKFVGLEVREKCVDDMKALGYDCRLAETEIFDMEERFDVIYGFAVLHHMSDPYETLRSLFKLLKPGGIMVFMNEGHPWDILALALTTYKGNWKYEMNTFKMNRKKFMHLLSRQTGNYYVRYEDCPFMTCFRRINSIYCKLKMNRIPFFNGLSIFLRKDRAPDG